MQQIADWLEKLGMSDYAQAVGRSNFLGQSVGGGGVNHGLTGVTEWSFQTRHFMPVQDLPGFALQGAWRRTSPSCWCCRGRRMLLGRDTRYPRRCYPAACGCANNAI
jgi:hypothetical protein